MVWDYEAKQRYMMWGISNNIFDISEESANCYDRTKYKPLYINNCNCRINRNEYYKCYRQKNTDRIKTISRNYYVRNQQKLNEYRKKYYQNNKEKSKEYHINHYNNNRDKIIEHMKLYNRNNKERIKNYNINNTKRNEIIQCSCGCMISKSNLKRHERSAKHLKGIE